MQQSVRTIKRAEHGDYGVVLNTLYGERPRRWSVYRVERTPQGWSPERDASGRYHQVYQGLDRGAADVLFAAEEVLCQLAAGRADSDVLQALYGKAPPEVQDAVKRLLGAPGSGYEPWPASPEGVEG